MSERGDIWLSRGFSVTCILSAFIGALMVGMLLGEPDVLMLFGAVGGVMVGAVLGRQGILSAFCRPSGPCFAPLELKRLVSTIS
jgi:hypothetical protein